MLRGAHHPIERAPGGVPAHAPPPRSRRRASRRSARQKCHGQNSRATLRPPPKKKGPPETTALVTRRSVWGESEAGRCASGLHGKQGEPRWGGTTPQTTPISVANYVSQPNGQRLNALLILAFFIFFGGLPSLQITTYYLTFNLY